MYGTKISAPVLLLSLVSALALIKQISEYKGKQARAALLTMP